MMNSMKNLHCTAMAILLLAVAAQATVFTDDFADGNTDGWYAQNTSAFGAWNADEGNMEVNQDNGTTAVLTSFSNTSLAVGDSISLSFSFYGAAYSAPDNAFRFGLLNSNATPVTGNNQNASDDDMGYLFTVGEGAEAHKGDTTADGGLLAHEAGSTGTVLNGVNVLDTYDVQWATTVWNTFTFTATRTAADAMSLQFDVTDNTGSRGDQTFTATHSGADVVTEFDEVAFYLTEYGTWYDYYRVDNVTVEYVPEPATMALMALGGLGVLIRRRRC